MKENKTKSILKKIFYNDKNYAILIRVLKQD